MINKVVQMEGGQVQPIDQSWQVSITVWICFPQENCPLLRICPTVILTHKMKSSSPVFPDEIQAEM